MSAQARNVRTLRASNLKTLTMKKTQLTFTTWRDVDRAVTNSEIKLRVVVRTFNVLKHKIFGGCSFAVVEDTPEQKTYSAILQYLRPEFRTN